MMVTKYSQSQYSLLSDQYSLDDYSLINTLCNQSQYSLIFCQYTLNTHSFLVNTPNFRSISVSVAVDKYQSKLTSLQERLEDTGSLLYPSITFCPKYYII